MYDLLEREIVPLFYTRDENGIPTQWVARVRESMARLTPQFAADRTVREYTEKYYLPAAVADRKRSANRGAPIAAYARKSQDQEIKVKNRKDGEERLS